MTDRTQQFPTRARRRPLLPALALSALAVGGLALAGCRRGGETAATQATPAAAQTQATQVSVTPARRATISDTAEVTGALSALQDVTVGVKAAGKVVAVYAREGDLVRAGQVVAQQDTADFQAQLEQQRATLNQQRANLATAQSKLEQAKVAYQNAQTTLKWTDDQTKSAVRQAQAALVSAQEQAAVVKQGARPQERQQAEENVAAAKANRDKARSDLKRYQDLYRQQAVSAQQLDQAQSVADSAEAQYNSAVQALSLIQEGSRPEDIRRAQAAVEQARQALVAAQSNRDQVNLRRADVETARVGILSAQAAVQQAQASVRQAEASVRLAAQQLADTAVRSPITGVVAERKAEPGMQLGAGKDVMRIVALDSIYFDAQLSETQYAEVRMGMPVAVTVDALPGRTFQGSVTKIYPVASTQSRSFRVRIGLKNEGNVLRPQMFARGQIVLATHPNAVIVPRDAVLDNNGKTGRLFVVENSTAKERKVTLGFSNLRVLEITSGLKEGEEVVTVGQAQIQDGDRVQALPNGAASLQ
ncbi:MAG TPA: efflux RND transporter periplasmic adaptor subunit [Chthonomonadaceae bacterium]|nr:efflux RND transporter periplasmic adaptor subunit [Chthonomonadaceae bacterium]